MGKRWVVGLNRMGVILCLFCRITVCGMLPTYPDIFLRVCSLKMAQVDLSLQIRRIIAQNFAERCGNTTGFRFGQ